MTTLDPEFFRTRLIRLKNELHEQEHEAEQSTQTVSLDQSSVGRLSRMDAMQSQQMALESSRRRKVQLTRIEAALERIAEGEYGYCAMCDEEINPKRLEADPANPFCVNCADQL